jgi:twitching motility protein PilT
MLFSHCKAMLTSYIQKFFAMPDVSDLHVHEGDPVWHRDAGVVKICSETPVTRQHILEFLASIQEEAGIDPNRVDDALKEKGDADFSARYAGYGIRGNIFRSGNRKLSLVLRRLNDEIPPMASLGLPDKVQSLIGLSKGIFLVTGATGSGKSTTLASILDYLNETTQRHIITIEDPVEYMLKDKHCHIDQRQIGRDAKSFPLALRAALRQDPDILLIGEMRDRDTVKTALDAANTGHLVLATLHTNNARQSVERMTSFFGGDEKEWAQQVISSVLLGVMSQVLVQRAQGRGRVLCSELMVNSPGIAQCIRDGKSAQIFNIMDTGRSEGQQLLNFDLAKKAQEGLISTENALYASYDPSRLQKELSNEY